MSELLPDTELNVLITRIKAQIFDIDTMVNYHIGTKPVFKSLLTQCIDLLGNFNDKLFIFMCRQNSPEELKTVFNDLRKINVRLFPLINDIKNSRFYASNRSLVKKFKARCEVISENFNDMKCQLSEDLDATHYLTLFDENKEHLLKQLNKSAFIKLKK